MPLCEQCGKEHDGKFGSGRFCCRSCSNKWVSLNQSDEAKRKKVEKGKLNLAINYGRGLTEEERKKGQLVLKDKYIEQNKSKKLLIEQILNNEVKANVLPHSLKEYLFKFGYKERRCEICNRTKWNGKPIPTQLHHINGNNDDNRLENLQILCHNCHAQTENYGWQNAKRNKRNKKEEDLDA